MKKSNSFKAIQRCLEKIESVLNDVESTIEFYINEVEERKNEIASQQTPEITNKEIEKIYNDDWRLQNNIDELESIQCQKIVWNHVYNYIFENYNKIFK